MFNRFPRRIAKAVTFDPAWMDENGFLTNVPVSDGYVTGVPDPYTHAVGAYIHSEPMFDVHGKPTGPVRDQMLTFSISKTKITQDLPRRRTAIITPSELRVEDSTKRVIEHWAPFFDMEGATAPVLKWRMTAQVSLHHLHSHGSNVPATLGSLYEAVSSVLEQAVRSLGHASILDEDFEDEAAEKAYPFRWVHAPTCCVTDATDYTGRQSNVLPCRRWIGMSTLVGRTLPAAWGSLLKVADEIKAASLEEKLYPINNKRWLKELEEHSIRFTDALAKLLHENPSMYEMI